MFLGIAGEFVIENVTVVHLLAVGHFAFFRIARVIEAGVVELPCDGSGTGALDGVGKNGAGFGFDDVQRAHFGAAGRGAVGDILSGLAGIVPVERDGAVGRKFVGIDQHAVGPVETVAYIKDWLVLHPLALGVEIVVAGDRRRRDVADREQVGQTFVDGLASREAIENAARVSHLLLDPLLRLRIFSVLQPAIIVENFRPVIHVDDRLLVSHGRSGGSRRSFGIVARINRGSQQNNERESREQTHKHLERLQ